MSDPRRLLLDENATDVERTLLRSWDAEAPSKGARAKTLAALGLAATGAAAAATAASSKAAAGSVAGGSVAPKVATGVSIFTVKWTAIGLATIGIAATSVGYFASGSKRLVTPAALAIGAPLSANVPQPVTGVAAAVPSATASIASGAAASSAGQPPPSKPAVSVGHASSAPPLPSSSLTEQIALLDSARAALAAGSAAAALRTLAEYETRFPRGAFTQEAEVLRIDAMLRSGQRASATGAAQRFLAAYPSSPHAPRLRALLEQAQ